MNNQAASMIMTIMYAAKMARFDFLKPVRHLARKMTKWTDQGERKLKKIIEYMHSIYELRPTGFVCDDPSELSLVQYSDADFASDRADTKSTSGLFFSLVRPMTFPPCRLV